MLCQLHTAIACGWCKSRILDVERSLPLGIQLQCCMK